jgi:hypothetical protein
MNRSVIAQQIPIRLQELEEIIGVRCCLQGQSLGATVEGFVDGLAVVCDRGVFTERFDG